MLASEGTEAMHVFYLLTFKDANPFVVPRFFMTDKDRAQMNAISRVYSKTRILLCWWHVLHAWQQHFNIREFPELWDKLKRWIRVDNEAEFSRFWDEIKQMAPPSLSVYLEAHWLNEKELWSAVHRKGRSIHEVSNTNMLIEA